MVFDWDRIIVIIPGPSSSNSEAGNSSLFDWGGIMIMMPGDSASSGASDAADGGKFSN